MRSLLLLTILAALAVLTLCYESHKVWNNMKLVPLLTEETLIPLCLRGRDGALKPKRGSENAANLPRPSLGKPVMTTSFSNVIVIVMVYGYNAAYNRNFRQRQGTK
ncbi:Matrix Gla protein [Heterocephalus glaber]|uniref:Matrix Gla protein n=1 Tax=Heterocephalus glaber TaxID=10181 RepID=G5ASP0_HETGA|nr:Matrix Gla protein [Heterocephalus glaber]